MKEEEQIRKNNLELGTGFCGVAIGLAIGARSSFQFNVILVIIFGVLGIVLSLQGRRTNPSNKFPRLTKGKRLKRTTTLYLK